MTDPAAPSPNLFFETMAAFQRTEALKAALELDLFTAFAGQPRTADQLAAACNAASRGVRILCDYLTIAGFLTKDDQHRYATTPDSAVFLDRHSPAYLGGAAQFLHSETLLEGFATLADAVRQGGTALPQDGTVDANHPVWVKFARGMAPLMSLPAQRLVELADISQAGPIKLLDIAAGHGLFGIAFARANPQAQVVALDWAAVLEVACENAARASVADRYSTIAGSAFEADFGDGYDIVLLTNFLHHFDQPTCVNLLRKVHRALKPGGRAITLEFIPNDDRVTPPAVATFNIVMLATTRSGDAYTASELRRMAAQAGFNRSDIHPLPPTLQAAMISHR